MKTRNQSRLADRRGRKYLTAAERSSFIRVAKLASRPEVQTFALILAYSGCRISEVLALRACDVDLTDNSVRVRTLKRRSETWREIPLPESFMRDLQLTHGLRQLQAGRRTKYGRLWRFSRSTASRHVAALMAEAKIQGPQACSKGLRHAFGIAAVEAGVPLPLIASILGHAQITTTAVYTTAVGIEARGFLDKMWNSD